MALALNATPSPPPHTHSRHYALLDRTGYRDMHGQMHPRQHVHVDGHSAMFHLPRPGPAVLSQTHFASTPSRQWPQTTRWYHQVITLSVTTGDPLMDNRTSPSQELRLSVYSQCRVKDESCVPPLPGGTGELSLSASPHLRLSPEQAATSSSVPAGINSPLGTRRWLRSCRVAWRAGCTAIPKSICGSWPGPSLAFSHAPGHVAL